MEALEVTIPNSLITERAEVNSKHSRLLAHAFVKVCHSAPYLCSILPQRIAILPQHIMFHLALGITYGWNAPCQLYVFSVSQSKWCENVKKK